VKSDINQPSKDLQPVYDGDSVFLAATTMLQISCLNWFFCEKGLNEEQGLRKGFCSQKYLVNSLN
jgi:hypothetical protein